MSKRTKKAIKLATKANTLNEKAIAKLDSDWVYIQAQTELLELLYEYHSLTQELLDMMNSYRKDFLKANNRLKGGLNNGLTILLPLPKDTVTNPVTIKSEDLRKESLNTDSVGNFITHINQNYKDRGVEE